MDKAAFEKKLAEVNKYAFNSDLDEKIITINESFFDKKVKDCIAELVMIARDINMPSDVLDIISTCYAKAYATLFRKLFKED